MSEAPPAAAQSLRTSSIRVALTAAAIVAVVYLVVAGAVFAIVTNNLTAQIDSRIQDAARHIRGGPDPGQGRFGPPPGERPTAVPLVVWTVRPDGTIEANGDAPPLPSGITRADSPQTVTVDGEQLRIAGSPVGGRYVIVGQSLDSVTAAQSTLIVAEIAIAPILLASVFFGAVLIGRRVAAPVEAARRRQMEFTADASHELRTPLSVIEAHTSLALAQDRSAEWYRRAFEKIEPEGRRMRRLLDDLLWLARFDAAQGAPNAEPVDLGLLARQAADRFGIVAETRRLTLTVAAAPGANVVAAPPEWLDRLLGVLLDNACRYAPEGGTVTVAVTGDAGHVRLAVDDSGPGIPADQRDRIFDRFHRATEKPGGAGLGLSIADAIVRATNGRWRIGSSPIGGASMTVSWPRALTGQPESATASVRAHVRE